MNESEKVAQAKKRVGAMMGFYTHAGVFVLVMALLTAVNVYSGSNWWVQWPLLGWGIGLLAHAVGVFGGTPQFIKNWQVRKIKEVKDGL